MTAIDDKWKTAARDDRHRRDPARGDRRPRDRREARLGPGRLSRLPRAVARRSPLAGCGGSATDRRRAPNALRTARPAVVAYVNDGDTLRTTSGATGAPRPDRRARAPRPTARQGGPRRAATARSRRCPGHARARPGARRDRPLRAAAPLRPRCGRERQRRPRPRRSRLAVLLPRRARPLRPRPARLPSTRHVPPAAATGAPARGRGSTPAVGSITGPADRVSSAPRPRGDRR